MAPPRVLLVHGVATTASVWKPVVGLLDGLEVIAVDRPCSGDLETELAFLAPLAEGAFVVGVSGGATLCLALAASGVQLAGGIAHEPAVGSLVPGLLAPMVAALAAGGPRAFAQALYGPSWTADMASREGLVTRELPMFRAFEPAAPRLGQGTVLVTVGGDSAPPRHAAAAALRDQLGYPIEALEGCRHFVQWDSAALFAGLIRRQVLASQF